MPLSRPVPCLGIGLKAKINKSLWPTELSEHSGLIRNKEETVGVAVEALTGGESSARSLDSCQLSCLAQIAAHGHISPKV